jgi:hypothetical protein
MRLTNIIPIAVLSATLFSGCDRGRIYPASAVFTERAKLLP